MTELNMEKFNPKKAELSALVEKFSKLQIKGIDDKDGYLAVDSARKELKTTRVGIQKQGKAIREEAIAFQKKVIEVEKDMVGIIEPLEQELKAKQDAIDNEKIKIARQESLPERKERLATIKLEVSGDELLEMDNNTFNSWFNERKEEYLEAKEAKAREAQEAKERELQAKQDKIDEANRKIAEAKRIEEAKKQAIKDEKARLEKEEKLKAFREKEAQEKLEAEKEYQKFLKDNDYTEDTKDNFYIRNEGNKVILYKKLSEFNRK